MRSEMTDIETLEACCKLMAKIFSKQALNLNATNINYKVENITDKDLFDIRRERKTYKTKFKYSTKIRDINKLEIGDFIVHNTSGIGIYIR